MTLPSNENSENLETFEGSPYLHDMVSRLKPGEAPVALDKDRVMSFMKRAFGKPEAQAALQQILSAFTYYGSLADNFGAFFPIETLEQSIDLDMSVNDQGAAPLCEELIEKLPDKPVVLAVLDEGIPFLNEVLRHSSGTSRMASIWLQDARPNNTPGANQPPFGRVLDNVDIQSLITAGKDAQSAYAISGALDFALPSSQRLALRTTHGAAVAALAAGEKSDKHLMMGVNFPPNAVRDTSGSTLPLFILLGICHCIESTQAVAEQLRKTSKRFQSLTIPLVFNLSYGVLAGPKDGSGILANVIQSLSQLAPNDIEGVGKISFVIPMGNGRQSQTSAKLGGEAEAAVALRLLPDDKTPSYVEVWSRSYANDKPDQLPFQLRLTPPQSRISVPTPQMAIGTLTNINFDCGASVRLYSDIRKSEAGYRSVLTLAFSPTYSVTGTGALRPGDWNIELLAPSENPVRLYVQRDEGLSGLSSGGRQPFFHHEDYGKFDPSGRVSGYDTDGSSCPVTRVGTTNAFACAPSSVAVGALVARSGNTATYSALGMDSSADDFEGDTLKPADTSLNYPGILTYGVASCARTRVSGTSIAAPQAALDIARQS